MKTIVQNMRMTLVSRTRNLVVLTLLVIGGAAEVSGEQADAAKKPASSDAIDRTRETIKMLDDIYKTTVVLVTDKYVNDEEDFPAGSAAIALFSAISEKGWHKVRLIDTTGKPYEAKNVAKDAFEISAVKKLMAGESFVEQVIEQDGKQRMRAATPVPVVMQKCVMCHPHYADVKPGTPIGAILYDVPVK